MSLFRVMLYCALEAFPSLSPTWCFSSGRPWKADSSTGANSTRVGRMWREAKEGLSSSKPVGQAEFLPTRQPGTRGATEQHPWGMGTRGGSGHPGFWSAPRDKTVNRSRPFSCESEGSHSDVKMSAKILPFTVYPKRLGNCWEVCGHSLGYFEQLRGDNHFWCRFPRSRGGISTEQRVA